MGRHVCWFSLLFSKQLQLFQSSVKHSSPNGIAAWCWNLSWESLSLMVPSLYGEMKVASLVAVDSARWARDSSHNNSPSLPVLFLVSSVHFSNYYSIEYKSKNSSAHCIPKSYALWVSKKSIHIVCLVVLSISISIYRIKPFWERLDLFVSIKLTRLRGCCTD